MTEATNEQPVQGPALSVQDLVTLRNVIDIASRRGAFQTNEFSTVGAIYTKLSQFIDGVTASQEGAEPAEAPAEE